MSLPPAGDGVMLVIAAPYDAPRRGLLLNDRWRALGVRSRGVRGWLAFGALVIAGASAARLQGVDDLWLGAIQLVPTVVADRRARRGAGHRAVGVLARRGHRVGRRGGARRPRRAGPRGAGGAGPGPAPLRRRRLRPAGAARPAQARAAASRARPSCSSSGRAPAGRRRGAPAIRSSRRAAALAAAALELPRTGRARPVRGAGRLPAIRIACVDARGLAPRSHQPDDTPEHADPAAATAALDLALGIADALDAELPARRMSAA